MCNEARLTPKARARVFGHHDLLLLLLPRHHHTRQGKHDVGAAALLRIKSPGERGADVFFVSDFVPLSRALLSPPSQQPAFDGGGGGGGREADAASEVKCACLADSFVSIGPALFRRLTFRPPLRIYCILQQVR